MSRQLGSLPIRGSIPPAIAALDTWAFSRVTELHYESGETTTVTLRLVTDDGAWVRLRLTGVTKLEVPAMSPNCWINELEISHIKDRGMEGIAFLIESNASDVRELECYCAEITAVGSSS